MTLEELAGRLRAFAEERDWEQFHSPKNLSMALAVEPKIGIPGLGMVGVENTFEVTPDGGSCLTGSSFDIICIAG